ncbi:receptor kinase-like protein Xa21 [Lycium ferocissimum]|uniref:receptor kinase-like protein Xa21 n=1 Tax=Lycium ferocissimum TaxID=112874 RepID=UPI0028155DD9|nr:receptor kinase-like protein Xa21 [Lycium ferocissimum]
MEFLNDYDISIMYHPVKANVVNDALSHKAVSMGSLALLIVSKRPLALEVQTLPNSFDLLDISTLGLADPLSIATRGRISCYELLQATDVLSESNLIGSGSFGFVYKGILRSGAAIAFRVFNMQLEVAFKRYGFHLSDFGISKLLGEDEIDLYTKTLATSGYIASEYGQEGLMSTKCDFYSFGIMLMETFTRRKPNDEMFEGDLSFKQWVSNSLPEAVMDVVDANLVTPIDNYLKLDCVASIMKLALDCCVESPARRTNMKDVVRMLQKIRVQLLAC